MHGDPHAPGAVGPSPMQKKWPWWKGCISAFAHIAADERMRPFWARNNDALYVHIGQSDMAYVRLGNTTQIEMFRTLLKIFGDYNLFLECALPTAMMITIQMHRIPFHQARLCTNWTPKRSHPSEWDCIDGPFDVFHPIKPSKGQWEMYFDQIALFKDARF